MASKYEQKKKQQMFKDSGSVRVSLSISVSFPCFLLNYLTENACFYCYEFPLSNNYKVEELMIG